MEAENLSADNIRRKNKSSEYNIMQDEIQQPVTKSSKPMIAGILLIIAGIITLVSLIPYMTIDIQTIESSGILEQLQGIDPDITAEQVKDYLTMCGTIGIILSIFPILGGVLSIKRKIWGVALIGAVIGLFGFLILIIPGILALAGLILIAMSRQEFQ